MTVTCYPVHRDALHPADAVGDHILSPRLVSLGPADGAQTHVHPVDGVVLWKKKGVVICVSTIKFPVFPKATGALNKAS